MRNASSFSRYTAFVFLLLSALIMDAMNCVPAAFAAKDEKAAAEAPAAASAQEKEKKAFLEQVKANVAALNLQGVTVQVLGMQYQKEQNNLQQMQAVFCDSYKLDVAKFRQGLYRFDEKEGKFVEQKV